MRLGLADKKVLILTDGNKPNVFLSGRNLPTVHVMPYSDVSTYHILWSDVVLIEAGALGQTLSPIAEEREAVSTKKSAAKNAPAKKPAAKKAAAPKAEKAPAKKTAAKTAAKKAAQGAGREEGGRQEAGCEVGQEEGEVIDANPTSHHRASADHREELGGVSGARRVHLRGARRRDRSRRSARRSSSCSA